MNQYKVVFTTERGKRHQQEALNAAPAILDVTILRQPNPDELCAHLQQADYLISERAGVIDRALIQSAPNLKMILRLGSLTQDIDIVAAEAAGIAVCYWPILSVIRVAEHLVMQMLVLSKRLRETEAVALAASSEWGESRRTNEDTFAYNWSKRERIDGFYDRAIGIWGFGEIGVELARRLNGWGCTLLYNKRRRLPRQVEVDLGLTFVESATLISQSDYLAILLPYFPETEMLIDAGIIRQMKDGAYLVGCGSGSVIDELALADAVQKGKLAGVALDTFEWEPIQPAHPLIKLAEEKHNVLLTPHVAAGAEVSGKTGRAQDYLNILNHIAGKPLINRIV